MKPSSAARFRAGWALAALTATGCLAYVVWQFVAASRLPDDGTDAAGMFMMSAIFVGGMLVGLIGLFLWLALPQERPLSLPPAGWYADPRRPEVLRYWDGAAWTDHTR